MSPSPAFQKYISVVNYVASNAALTFTDYPPLYEEEETTFKVSVVEVNVKNFAILQVRQVPNVLAMLSLGVLKPINVNM